MAAGITLQYGGGGNFDAIRHISRGGLGQAKRGLGLWIFAISTLVSCEAIVNRLIRLVRIRVLRFLREWIILPLGILSNTVYLRQHCTRILQSVVATYCLSRVGRRPVLQLVREIEEDARWVSHKKSWFVEYLEIRRTQVRRTLVFWL